MNSPIVSRRAGRPSRRRHRGEPRHRRRHRREHSPRRACASSLLGRDAGNAAWRVARVSEGPIAPRGRGRCHRPGFRSRRFRYGARALRAGAHPHQQRRPGGQREVHRYRRGAVAPHDGRQCDRHLLVLPPGRAGHAAGRIRPHRQHRQHRRTARRRITSRRMRRRNTRSSA